MGLDNKNHNNPTVPVSEKALIAGGVTSHVGVAGGHGGGGGGGDDGGLTSLPASGVLTAGNQREEHGRPRAAGQNGPERDDGREGSKLLDNSTGLNTFKITIIFIVREH